MKKVRQKLHLIIFPLAYIGCLVPTLAIFKLQVLFCFLGIIFSSLLLNFCLHITIHHQVHFKQNKSWKNIALEIFYSLLMGIPFKNYQIGHLSHHKYNNNLGDFTSTWEGSNLNPKPQNIWKYSFLWFSKAKDIKENRKQAINQGFLSSQALIQQKLESLFILILIITLAIWSPIYAFIYISVVYLGWCFIALHNYGQHPPLIYGKPKAYSYYNRFYNFLFINNGWHEEHHENPQLSYWELEDTKNTRTQFPHLIDGFFHSKNQQKKEEW